MGSKKARANARAYLGRERRSGYGLTESVFPVVLSIASPASSIGPSDISFDPWVAFSIAVSAYSPAFSAGPCEQAATQRPSAASVTMPSFMARLD